ncbi:MAG: hypothetical protein WCP70_14460 [Methanothrix sp.]
MQIILGSLAGGMKIEEIVKEYDLKRNMFLLPWHMRPE